MDAALMILAMLSILMNFALINRNKNLKQLLWYADLDIKEYRKEAAVRALFTGGKENVSDSDKNS